MSGLKDVFLHESPMLLRLLTARLGSPDDAQDALQDMWLKLDQIADGPMAHPAAYLYRMAANLATDRRLARNRSQVRDDAWHGLQPAADEIPDAEAVLLARERLAQVEATIAAMPERMAQALRLFRLEKCPQKEIAQRLGITVSGVEKLLKRAYRQLYDAEQQ